MTFEEFDLFSSYVEEQRAQLDTISNPEAVEQMKKIGIPAPTEQQLATISRIVELLERARDIVGANLNGVPVVCDGFGKGRQLVIEGENAETG